jgi:pimeloyl-ACP methyl ester carboxylesterase
MSQRSFRGRRASPLAFLALTLALAHPMTSASAACPSPPAREFSRQVNGVRLDLIDWGGHGPPLILLAGLTDSAAIFCDLAPRLTSIRHVYSFTRRGFGHSQQTAGGYDMASLAADVIGLMDSLGIVRADIVGHSIAGGEMTAVASKWPRRVRRLVYLDAAYDRADVGALAAADPGEPRAPTATALHDLASLTAWRERELGFASPAIAANLAQTYVVGPNRLRPRTPAAIVRQVEAGDRAAPPNYRRILAPALALYAPKDHAEQIPPEASAARRRAATEYSLAKVRPWMLREKARFEREIACGQAAEVPGAGHYFFLERPAQTAAVIAAFLTVRNPCTAVGVTASLTRP